MRLLIRAFIFGLFSYGMLYYAYKYYHPRYGGHDYVWYYKMYLSPVANDAPDPFRFRKISAFITFFIYKSGLYYPNDIVWHNPKYFTNGFFAALLSNYIALLGTALICSYILEENGASPLLSGIIVLLGFGTQAFVLTGLTEGWAWFLMALAFWCYLRRHYWWLGVVLLLSAFQRETIPVVMGVFAALDLWQHKNEAPTLTRGYKLTLLFAFTALVLYLGLRAVDSVPGIHSKQLQLTLQWQNLIHFRPDKEFVFRAVFSQNLLFLLGAVALLVRFQKKPAPLYAFHLVLVAAILMVGGISTGIGYSVGRILAILTPLLAPILSVSLTRIKV